MIVPISGSSLRSQRQKRQDAFSIRSLTLFSPHESFSSSSQASTSESSSESCDSHLTDSPLTLRQPPSSPVHHFAHHTSDIEMERKFGFSAMMRCTPNVREDYFQSHTKRLVLESSDSGAKDSEWVEVKDAPPQGLTFYFKFNTYQELEELARTLRADPGLEVCDRFWRQRKFENSFVGSELVDWMLQNLKETWGIHDRRMATMLGQNLIDCSFIRKTRGENRFRDGHAFYQFDVPQMHILNAVNHTSKKTQNQQRSRWARAIQSFSSSASSSSASASSVPSSPSSSSSSSRPNALETSLNAVTIMAELYRTMSANKHHHHDPLSRSYYDPVSPSHHYPQHQPQHQQHDPSRHYQRPSSPPSPFSAASSSDHLRPLHPHHHRGPSSDSFASQLLSDDEYQHQHPHLAPQGSSASSNLPYDLISPTPSHHSYSHSHNPHNASYGANNNSGYNVRDVPEVQSREFQLFKQTVQDLQRVSLDELLVDSSHLCCFFINVYNTLFMHALMTRDPPLPGKEPWVRFCRQMCYQIDGMVFSLLDIHFGVLRANLPSAVIKPEDQLVVFPPKFLDERRVRYVFPLPDPRISFALCSGTAESPQLQIYRPDTLDTQLTQAVQLYIKEHFLIHYHRHQLYPTAQAVLPGLMRLLRTDFGKSDAKVLAWIADYHWDSVEQSNLFDFINAKSFTVEYLPYDWRRNLQCFQLAPERFAELEADDF